MLQWCADSWNDLEEETELIINGWTKCCISLFNLNDPNKRIEAMAAVAKRELDHALLPEEVEEEAAEQSSEESEDELNISQPRAFGKQSGRVRKQAASHGYMLSSSAIAMSEDSDA